jgi:hypothetical protein
MAAVQFKPTASVAFRNRRAKSRGEGKAKGMGGLRPFVEDDISSVADLIWRVLHERKGPAPSSLRTHLQDLFLRNPWMDDGIVSRVFENTEGKLVGFFGAVPRRMSIQGETIRLAFGSNLVVDPESRASVTAMQLVRAFMKGTQDISITDSANEMSRPLLKSLGFNVVPIYSLQWARPLRPSQYALNGLSRLNKNSRAVATIASVARPFGGVVDAVVTRARMSPLRQSQPATNDEDLDTETLLECLATIPAKHWILPEYDRESLSWVLDFIVKRRVFGDLRKAIVRDKDGKIVGWYIYSIAPGAVGEVLQLGAASPSMGIVLDHLFYDGWKHGLVGIHGRMEPQFMQELTSKSCFFLRHGSWTLVNSNRPQLLNLFQSGSAFFSRLDGEWSLRHGGGGET